MNADTIITRSDSTPNRVPEPARPSACSNMEERSAAARRTLHSVPGDPFLFADWERVLFLHFTIDHDLLKPHVPAPFELELYNGQGCLSLVCVTMRKLRPYRFDPA